MNMRKKVFIITIGSLTALVILLLAGIIVLNGRKETRVYNGTTMSRGNENSTTEDNTIENKNQVTNTEDNTVVAQNQMKMKEIHMQEQKMKTQFRFHQNLNM